MNNFEYWNPVRIIFGAGELKKIGQEAAKLGKSVCLVSYKDLGFLIPLPINQRMLLDYCLLIRCQMRHQRLICLSYVILKLSSA